MAKSFPITRAAKGVLLAFAISLVFTLALSLVYFLTSLQESLIHTLIITGLSVLLASFTAAYRSGAKGLYYGLSIGIGFSLLSVIIYNIFYEGNFAWLIVLEKLIICLVSGIIGGTLGAVLKR